MSIIKIATSWLSQKKESRYQKKENDKYNRVADNFDVDFVNGIMFITCNGICVRICSGETTVDEIKAYIYEFIENAIIYNKNKTL